VLFGPFVSMLGADETGTIRGKKGKKVIADVRLGDAFLLHVAI
jgi:hypothetical protein